MPQSEILVAYAGDANHLKPSTRPDLARRRPVVLGPSATYKKGTVLGLTTAGADDVQTITVSGAPTGGTFTLAYVDPLTGASGETAALAYNADAAAIQTALQAAFGAGNVTVTGTGPFTATFGGDLAAMPVPPMTLGTNALTGGTNPTVAVAHTTTGAQAGAARAYASGNSDGSQTPVGILADTWTTDDQGRAFLGTTTTPDPAGAFERSVSMYTAGAFFVTDLAGLDANAVTKLGGHLTRNSLTAGEFVF